MRREGANLDLSWIRTKSLEDSADLEDPDVVAEEIADDSKAALEQFAAIASGLRGGRRGGVIATCSIATGRLHPDLTSG